MKIRIALLAVFCLGAFSLTTLSQTTPTLLKRTTTKTDRFDFGVGGTLAITGAPVGSIRVEGWSNREVEVTADIEVQAATEPDLVAMSEATTFVLDESLGRVVITSVGTHDRKYVKKLGKRIPKDAATLPFRIDYVIKVPRYCDLQIDGGRGDLTVSGVEGMMRLNFIETKATVDLVGGGVVAVFGKGDVDLTIPRAGWRGRFADVQLANGEMNVNLPAGLNAEVDATILRTGKIENAFAGLKPRVRRVDFTDRSIAAKAGIGGVSLKFTVGDGTLKIKTVESRL